MSDQLAVWWEGLPPVAAEIDCGGERHVIRWERGRLITEDHDLEAEQTLVALGSVGPAPVCLDIAQAWQSTRLMPELQIALGDHAAIVPGSPEARRVEERIVASRGRARGLASSLEAVAQSASQVSGQLPDVVRSLLGDTVTSMVEGIGGRITDTSKRQQLLARLEPAIVRMPPELRFVLALQIARQGRDPAAPEEEPFASAAVGRIIDLVTSVSSSLTGEGVVGSVGDLVGRRSAEALVTSLARTWGLHTEKATNLLGDSFPAVVSSLGAPGEVSVQSRGVSITCSLAGPDAAPAADIHLDGGAVSGTLTLPAWWPRRVYARGICREQLVLGILGESMDHRTLLVNACKWDTEAGRDVVRTARAELTSTLPGVWRMSRWLD